MGTKIHFCHVSRERMKLQGYDGLSRGNLSIGVMAGKDILSFVPLHLKASDRFEGIKDWINEWTGDDKMEWLSPEGWFTRGHDLMEKEWEINVDGLKLPTFSPGLFVW